jgi:hypothetical protein
LMVFAFAGDSTMTRFSAMPASSVGSFRLDP